jgi:hypothetical protein
VVLVVVVVLLLLLLVPANAAPLLQRIWLRR